MSRTQIEIGVHQDSCQGVMFVLNCQKNKNKNNDWLICMCLSFPLIVLSFLFSDLLAKTVYSAPHILRDSVPKVRTAFSLQCFAFWWIEMCRISAPPSPQQDHLCLFDLNSRPSHWYRTYISITHFYIHLLCLQVPSQIQGVRV